jgi:hypothetical protein
MSAVGLKIVAWIDTSELSLSERLATVFPNRGTRFLWGRRVQRQLDSLDARLAALREAVGDLEGGILVYEAEVALSPLFQDPPFGDPGLTAPA